MSRRAQDTHTHTLERIKLQHNNFALSIMFITDGCSKNESHTNDTSQRRASLHTYTTFEIKRNEAKPNWACATGSVPLEVRPSALHRFRGSSG